MGRGKLKEETVRQRSLAKALQFLQQSGAAPEVLEQIDQTVIDKPAETRDDKLREAQSCLYYFSTNGSGFKEKECKECHKIFAYNWNVDSISYCSVSCASKGLMRIGIKWNPDKDQKERWGKYAPAVVPPAALEILKDQLSDSLKDQPVDTDLPESQQTDEEVVSDPSH